MKRKLKTRIDINNFGKSEGKLSFTLDTKPGLKKEREKPGAFDPRIIIRFRNSIIYGGGGPAVYALETLEEVANDKKRDGFCITQGEVLSDYPYLSMNRSETMKVVKEAKAIIKKECTYES